MRRRIAWLLPWLSLAFVFGVIAGDRSSLNLHCWGLLAAACGLVVPLVARSPTGVALCAAGLFLSLGAARLCVSLEVALGSSVRRSVDSAVEGTVCSLRSDSDWVRAELCDVVAVPFGATGRLPELPARLSWVEDAASEEGRWLSARAPGDWVRARLRIGPLTGLRNPGGRDRSLDLRRRGIGGRARLIDARLAMSTEESGSARVPSVRRVLAERLMARGPGGSLFAALGLGDRSGLAREDREAFRRLGISHLLAVSGLHLVLVAAVAFAGIRWVGIRVPALVATRDVRLGAVCGAVLLAAAYAVLAGGGIPVRRALVFGMAVAAALVLGRPRIAPHALAIAALGIAFFDPAAVFGVGAQLSFCATAALLADTRAPWVVGSGGSGAFTRSMWAGLRVSATAIAATAPVLAAHGIASSAFGLIANSVAVPWTAFVLLPVSIAATGLVAAVPGWETPIAGLVVVSDMSLAVVRAASAGLPAAAGSVAGLTGWTLGLGFALATLCARRTSARVLLAAAACGVFGWAPPDDIAPAAPRIIVLDVGLGDALLVQGTRGAVLVDAGWALAPGADLGRSVVVPALRALGVRKLDVAVATHADLDHRGGLPAVLREIPVGEVWLPPTPAADFTELRTAARRANVPVRVRHRGEPRVSVGDLGIDVLWPPRELPASGSRNDGSLVLAVSVDTSRLLLTGDIGAAAERALLRSGTELRASILKVAHHGSRGSSTEAFLQAVSPEVALISAPCSRRARLPTREAIARLEAVGASVGWTGREGALLVPFAAGRPPSWTGWSRNPNCQLP